ncbi:hypothetical protein ACS0TY_033358 [Phlomoides rotata]
MFLLILAHHKKISVVKSNHQRSGQTGCLGTIDDTYANVHVPEADKRRYRKRKGIISINVLAACDRNCMFTYNPAWVGRVGF